MNELIGSMNFAALNNFDFLVIGLVILSVTIAFIRGFIKSFISFLGWSVSIAIGMYFSSVLTPIISKYVNIAAYVEIFSGIALFLIAALVIAIINNVFYIALGIMCGGILDRSIGVFFGFIRGCILVSFIFYILLLMTPQLNVKDQEQLEKMNNLEGVPAWAKDSESILLLNKGATFIRGFVPKKFEKNLKIVLSKDDTDAARAEGQEADEDMEEGESINVEKNVRLTKILASLPKEVLNKVSQEDFVLMQDKMSSPQEKIRVLENVKQEYQDYMDNEDQSLTKESISKKIKYYRLMSMIENEIMEYTAICDQ